MKIPDTEKKECPECHALIYFYPVGYTNADGEWEYDHMECPVCGYVASSEDTG